MIQHRLTIDTYEDDNGSEETLNLGRCDCGEEVGNWLTWQEAYDAILEHVSGFPDEAIILPETPEWLDDQAQAQTEFNAR